MVRRSRSKGKGNGKSRPRTRRPSLGRKAKRKHSKNKRRARMLKTRKGPTQSVYTQSELDRINKLIKRTNVYRADQDSVSNPAVGRNLILLVKWKNGEDWSTKLKLKNVADFTKVKETIRDRLVELVPEAPKDVKNLVLYHDDNGTKGVEINELSDIKGKQRIQVYPRK
jgi:hypothetical protein